jgi:transposase
MQPLKLQLSQQQLQELEQLYRKSKQVRLRTRAQIILLNAEKGMTCTAIADVVRMDRASIQRILHRYQANGVAGLSDRPRSGRPSKMNAAYLEELLLTVRRRPRSLGLDYSLWTLSYLQTYMEAQTGIRLGRETIRVHLKRNGMVLSRPQHKISSPDPEYMVKKND